MPRQSEDKHSLTLSNSVQENPLLVSGFEIQESRDPCLKSLHNLEFDIFVGFFLPFIGLVVFGEISDKLSWTYFP